MNAQKFIVITEKARKFMKASAYKKSAIVEV